VENLFIFLLSHHSLHVQVAAAQAVASMAENLVSRDAFGKLGCDFSNFCVDFLKSRRQCRLPSISFCLHRCSVNVYKKISLIKSFFNVIGIFCENITIILVFVIIVTSWCSTDSKRPHCCCHLPNNFRSCHLFSILHNGSGDSPQIATFLGSELPPNTWFFGAT